MEKMNEIKLPEGVDSISVTQHDNKIVIEFIPEEPKFKEGDFVYEDGRIMIVKIYPNMYHANAYPKHSNTVDYNACYGVDFSSPTFRCAAEEEKQLLIDAMKKDGKQWNAEKLTVEDIPQSKFKRGDILISTVEPDLTVIFDKTTSTTTFDSIYNNGEASNHYWCLGLFRHATKEEKQEFFDELEVKGKRWNDDKKCIEDIPKRKFKVGDKVKIKDGISSETHRGVGPYFTSGMDEFIGEELTVKKYCSIKQVSFYEDDYGYEFAEDWLEPWSEEPKKGDLAIFWDNAYRNPLIRLYDTKRRNKHFDNMETYWDNAVKWDGTKEQFEKVLRGEI